ncbi:MAG: dipeptidase [Phycisphaerae bacterium]
MLPRQIVEYLESHRDSHMSSLFDFLRIPSIANVQDTPDSCQRAAAWLADYLTKLGFEAKIMPVAGGEHDRPNVVATAVAGDDKPTLLIYGHYDVQPPDPLDQWLSPPFEPTIRDGQLFCRGVSDDKGQLFTNITAVEAWMKTSGLPVNIKILAEGQEEVGSPHLEPWIAANAALLKADAALIGDSGWFAEDLPSIIYALRGIAYFELTVKGPSVDIHSGTHGGAVANPVNALARIIAAMHDKYGKVAIPGFYDEVLRLTPAERRAWRKLPFDEAEYAKSLGVPALGGGERRLGLMERRWARPTLDCNGIFGGYSGPGSKTIIPAQAGAKFSIRLVSNQDPAKIVAAVKQFVADHTPPGVTAEVDVHTANRPVIVATDSPAMAAARAAVKEAFGKPPAMVRCGASVPVAELVKRILGIDGVLLGHALPGDNCHSPNERMKLGQLHNGAVATAAFMQNLAEHLKPAARSQP